MTQPFTYKDAGVDIDAGNEATSRIKGLVALTRTANVLSEVGGFGGLFSVAECPERLPVLVSSIDSVGTKTKVAVACNRFDTIGRDIVNHCTNDILVQGARPLFFLDYVALGKLDPSQMEKIVQGVAEACVENQCALIGGEMCEMPDVYQHGDVDLVGCIVGVVAKPRILDGSRVREGDRLIGLESSGLHTNGYTLARKALYGDDPARIHEKPDGWEATIGEVLLVPHRSYFPVLWPLIDADKIHALAHITGGGITGNLARVIPDGLVAHIDTASWNPAPVFQLLAEKTQAPREELYRTFNMGIGMIAALAADQVDSALDEVRASGIGAWDIGSVSKESNDGKVVLD